MQLSQRKSSSKITKWLSLTLTAFVIVSLVSWSLNKIQPPYCTQQPLGTLLQKSLTPSTIHQGHCTLRTGLILLSFSLLGITYLKKW